MSAALTHTVLVGWKDDAPADVTDRASSLVEEIAATCPGIESVVEGASVSSEGLEGPFTWGLVIGFESQAALATYLVHPSHLPLAALIGEHQDALAVFDIPR